MAPAPNPGPSPNPDPGSDPGPGLAPSFLGFSIYTYSRSTASAAVMLSFFILGMMNLTRMLALELLPELLLVLLLLLLLYVFVT